MQKSINHFVEADGRVKEVDTTLWPDGSSTVITRYHTTEQWEKKCDAKDAQIAKLQEETSNAKTLLTQSKLSTKVQEVIE